VWTDHVRNESTWRVISYVHYKEGRLIVLIASCVGTVFETRYWRKGRGKCRSDGKTRKKM
jgi:hypothetical protein